MVTEDAVGGSIETGGFDFVPNEFLKSDGECVCVCVRERERENIFVASSSSSSSSSSSCVLFDCCFLCFFNQEFLFALLHSVFFFIHFKRLQSIFQALNPTCIKQDL